MKPTYFPIIEKAYLNGKWITSKKTIDVINPANQKSIGSIPNLNEKDTTKAIDAAYKAFPAWSSTTALHRANILLKWHERILENKEALAKLLSLECGKALAEARGEIDYGASFVRWFAEEIRRTDGDVLNSEVPNKRFLVIKQAIGVVGAITPWNFPMGMITRKCAPAFAAGCTVVLKPSELTPFSALALAKLSEQAGFPTGVLNIVTGDAKPIGDTLCADPRVRKISFTGSTSVGQYLAAQSAATLKRVSLELGGNAPFIIFDDANIEKTVAETLVAKFRNNGQTCVCANRILVHEKIANAYVKNLANAVKQLRVGLTYQDEKAQLGPLINQAGIDKVSRLVKDAVSKGAKVCVGGKSHKLGGYFFEPTILTHVTQKMSIAEEEIFGPVLAIQTFKDEKEAIALANDTHAGLAAYIFTENTGRQWRMTEALHYGMVGVNTGMVSSTIAPFGGVKYSGYGREGSKYGLEEYQSIKTLCIDVG